MLHAFDMADSKDSQVGGGASGQATNNEAVVRNNDTSNIDPADRKALNTALSDKPTMELMHKQGMKVKGGRRPLKEHGGDAPKKSPENAK